MMKILMLSVATAIGLAGTVASGTCVQRSCNGLSDCGNAQNEYAACVRSEQATKSPEGQAAQGADQLGGGLKVLNGPRTPESPAASDSTHKGPATVSGAQ
jgi:hypothetical protein